MNRDARAVAAEALGTGLLVAVIVGSGIMGERLGGGNAAIALLANSLATGFGLAALILTLAPLSGAHFNPVVTLVAAYGKELAWRAVPAYLFAQVAGAVLGVLGCACDVRSLLHSAVQPRSRRARAMVE